MDGLVVSVSYVILWVVVLVQTVVLVEVLRQVGILRRRLGDEAGALIGETGLERGSLGPSFSRRELQTGRVVSETEFRGKNALLLFLSPRCQSCRELAPHLPQFVKEIRDEAQLVTVCSGPADECERFLRTIKLSPILLDPDQSMGTSFRSLQTPNATLLDVEGRVRIQGIATTTQHLEGLLNEEGTPMGHRQWLLAGKEVEAEPALGSPGSSD